MSRYGRYSDAVSRKTYHHGDLEKALVSQGLHLVRERGADAVSLRQVAQAVGVSPSAAYAHFPDKLALMAAVASAGMEIFDARMAESAREVDIEDGDVAAVFRFNEAGRAYLGFAVEEPHLFRHIFGPSADAHTGPDELEAKSTAYQVLCERLDDLEDRGLLRPGARNGLDLASWTMVHGFSALVLDGLLPSEVGGLLVEVLSRLALSDEAAALVEAAAALAQSLSAAAPVSSDGPVAAAR